MVARSGKQQQIPHTGSALLLRSVTSFFPADENSQLHPQHHHHIQHVPVIYELLLTRECNRHWLTSVRRTYASERISFRVLLESLPRVEVIAFSMTPGANGVAGNVARPDFTG